MRLLGNHAVITGAAGGIGRALALGFVAQGARITCLDVDQSGVEKTVALAEDAGGEANAYRCDVTSWDDVTRSLDEAVGAFGPVDNLVACAGGAHGVGMSPFLQLDPARWNAMIDLNLTGNFYCGLVYARHMAANLSGSMVFITSEAGEVAHPGLAHYCAAKGGLRQLVKVMAVELAPTGVRVNAVAPGPTSTARNRHLREDPKASQSLTDAIPLGRWAEPEEMVGAAVYLASGEASFTTGATILVDGGYTAL